jgi:hypothetical protein
MAALGKFTTQACTSLDDLLARKKGFELMVQVSLNPSILQAKLTCLLQFSLWGNKSDLSLMADFDGSSSLSHLQVGVRG